MLLNVGPRPDGLIDPEQVARLKEIGDWLARNGESIYGTRGGPWKPVGSITSTRKANNVYIHLISADQTRIELPVLPAKIKSATLLNGGKVEFSQTDGKLILTVPASALDPSDTIIKLELDRSALDLPVLTPAPEIKATASNVFQKNEAEYGADKAFDNDPETRWATDSGTKQAWIAADLGRPRAIGHLQIQESKPYAGRVTKFEFQYRDGDVWKTIFSGAKIGARFQKTFTPVTAREFRLNILDATEGPTLSEIELSR